MRWNFYVDKCGYSFPNWTLKGEYGNKIEGLVVKDPSKERDPRDGEKASLVARRCTG